MKSELRYGVIGVGSMGREHISNIKVMGGATVTAISDPHTASIDAALEMAPGAKAFSDHRDLLDSGLIDAVIVATPNDTHAAVLKDALATDLAVFVEKPLATTISDLKSILDWGAKRSAMTWMGLEYRFMPPVTEPQSEDVAMVSRCRSTGSSWQRTSRSNPPVTAVITPKMIVAYQGLLKLWAN